ncbi:MAG: hypothetical protein HY817_03785 [Candidatus Abawacabacteria bacterium]|nr:hypothetical protein [Candidatus Abawacabacteria bacterium]
MERSRLLQVLTACGLDKRESAFYLASLALGKATMSKIAWQAELNRSASYEVMRSLKSLGLISTVKSKLGLLVIASDPERLLVLQREKYEAISQSLESLRYLFTVAQSEPGVRMFEGLEGMKQVLQMVLNEASEVLVFGDGDAFRKAVPGWTEEYSSKRLQRKIKSRLLLKATVASIGTVKSFSQLNSEKSRLSQIRVLPAAFNIVGGFDVFADKVILFSFDQKNTAVVIESKVISAMMRGIFEMLWTLAEGYNQTLLG